MAGVSQERGGGRSNAGGIGPWAESSVGPDGPSVMVC